MHPKVLKALAQSIFRPLMLIFNKSWNAVKVPEDWMKYCTNILKG